MGGIVRFMVGLVSNWLGSITTITSSLIVWQTLRRSLNFTISVKVPAAAIALVKKQKPIQNSKMTLFYRFSVALR